MFSMANLFRRPAAATTRRSRAWLCAVAALSAATIATPLSAAASTQASVPAPAAVSGPMALIFSGCTLNGQPVPSFQADSAAAAPRPAAPSRVVRSDAG